VIRASDVQLLPAEKDAAASTSVQTLDEIIGKELKRSLPAGQAVASDLLQSPRLVHRGEDVTIKSFAAGVVITTGGKAVEEGGQGDVIPVELADQRERVFARVIDFRTVAIYAQTPKFAGAHAVSK
jgi:flagella basal body P-ring formation protein FlgA